MEGDSLNGDAVNLAVWSGARRWCLLQLDTLANYFPGKNAQVLNPNTLLGGLCSCSGSSFPPLLSPRVSQVSSLPILSRPQCLTFSSDGCWRREESARQGGPTKLRYKKPALSRISRATLASVLFAGQFSLLELGEMAGRLTKLILILHRKVDHTRIKSKVDHTKMKSKVGHTAVQMRSKVQVNEEEVSLKQPTASSGKKGGLMDIMRYPT